MMKDKYDYNSYQRKKAEKSNFNKEILSYQEIANKMNNNENNENEVENNKVNINKRKQEKKNTTNKNQRKNSKYLLLNKKINIINTKFNNKNENEAINNKIEAVRMEKENNEENLIQFPCLRRNHVSLLIGSNIVCSSSSIQSL